MRTALVIAFVLAGTSCGKDKGDRSAASVPEATGLADGSAMTPPAGIGWHANGTCTVTGGATGTLKISTSCSDSNTGDKPTSYTFTLTTDPLDGSASQLIGAFHFGESKPTPGTSYTLAADGRSGLEFGVERFPWLAYSDAAGGWSAGAINSRARDHGTWSLTLESCDGAGTGGRLTATLPAIMSGGTDVHIACAF